MSVNRRTVLGTAVTMPALMLPAIAAPVEKVSAWERARNLASELADVLNEGEGGFDGPGGKWLAEIYPSAGREYPVAFGNISSRNWSERNVSLPCQTVIDAHRQARAVFTEACKETDCDKPSRAAWRRWRKAERADDAALIAVMAFRPHGDADAGAKVAYLLPLIERREVFEERHLIPLIKSMVRS